MDLEKLSIEEIDALSEKLSTLKREKLEEARRDFIKKLIATLETATNDWDLFEAYGDETFSVNFLIDRLREYLYY